MRPHWAVVLQWSVQMPDSGKIFNPDQAPQWRFSVSAATDMRSRSETDCKAPHTAYSVPLSAVCGAQALMHFTVTDTVTWCVQWIDWCVSRSKCCNFGENGHRHSIDKNHLSRKSFSFRRPSLQCWNQLEITVHCQPFLGSLQLSQRLVCRTDDWVFSDQQ